ncbi:restriction endonuclease subunit S [Sporosarcina sp. SAFN-010]|uniref:restriction endonuclease subunit S n=1 Tax=Sporosarcina sp. SAFN-010 TaxID=3387273 RepID=UPI003F80325B
MKAQQLKNSILQYAMQGKLVAQDSNDEPINVLQLNEDKTLNFKENSPPFTSGEVPFELPDSWAWARLDQLGIVQTGTTPSTSNKENYGDYIPFIKPGDIFGSYIDYDNQKLSETGIKKGRLISKNSILMVCIGGSRGKCYYTDRDVSCNQQINTLTPFADIVDLKYLYYILTSNYFKDLMIYQATGTATPIINKTKWCSFLVPICSLSEQKKIAKRIQEIFEVIDHYDALEQELTALNTNFPTNMEKSILQYAMQGKLVEQDHNDEPASLLLEQIAKEKEQLIKDKMIKREKALPPITDKEIPFEIPDSWEWVRLNDITSYIQRGKSPKYSDIKEIPIISQKCVQWSGFSLDKARFLNPDAISSYTPIRYLKKNDLLWNSTGLGTLGRIAIYSEVASEYKTVVADSHVTIIRPFFADIVSKFIYYFIASPLVQNNIEDICSGSTKQKELNTTTVKSFLVPFPPLSEQQRIIAEIENILSYTNQLTSVIAAD